MKDSLSPSNIGITRGLVGKMQDMLGHGILKSEIFEEVPTEEIDSFVKLMGNGLRAEWMKELEEKFNFFSHSANITVDFDESDALEQAMKKSQFIAKHSVCKFSDIPLSMYGRGKVEQRVFELCLDQELYNRDLPRAFKNASKELGFAHGFDHVDPLTFISYATRKCRRKHTTFMFATLFGAYCMYCMDDDILHITHHNQLEWGKRTQFLVVAEPVRSPLLHP